MYLSVEASGSYLKYSAGPWPVPRETEPRGTKLARVTSWGAGRYSAKLRTFLLEVIKDPKWRFGRLNDVFSYFEILCSY